MSVATSRQRESRGGFVISITRGIRQFHEQGVDKMLAVLENALEQYNESNAVMDLVLFEDAMKHIARISRADSAQKMNLNLTLVASTPSTRPPRVRAS